MKVLLLGVALLAAATDSDAQAVYKCGNAYSQTPCGDNAAEVKVYKGGEHANIGLKGEALCRESVPKAVSLLDPDSAKIEMVGKPKGTTVSIGGQPIEAMRYGVFMNAKNAYGAYTGAKLYYCYLSIDGRRVINVETIG